MVLASIGLVDKQDGNDYGVVSIRDVLCTTLYLTFRSWARYMTTDSGAYSQEKERIRNIGI